MVTAPIPLSVVLDFKTDSEGKINKFKTRMAIAGHPGILTKGVHYDKTYSPTPVQHTNKILQALMVRFQWKRLILDVSQAFLNSELEENQKFAIRYPTVLRRFDESGKELYMLLLKNCYGLPNASRSWSKHRDAALEEIFNIKEDGYTWNLKRCLKDPCLFKVSRKDKNNHTEQAIFQAHVDDIDAIGSSDGILEHIFKKINARWKSVRADDSYCLGIKRTIQESKGYMSVELTMQAFIESIENSFPQHITNR